MTMLGRVLLNRPRFDLVQTEAGWHVVLVAGNGEPLMTSENFPDERTARKNISAVRRCVLRAIINVRKIADT